jgi:DNA-directed RNA polymerase delta subunit
MIEDAAALLWPVWSRTDWDQFEDSGRNPQDEFASRVRTAADTSSVANFISRLADKWGVRSFYDTDEADDTIREIVERYDRDASQAQQRKFLRTVRQNNRLAVKFMRDSYSSETEEDDR